MTSTSLSALLARLREPRVSAPVVSATDRLARLREALARRAAPSAETARAPTPAPTRGGSSSSRASATCDACGETWPRDPALEVACPICHVRVGTLCKRPSGHKAMQLHRKRDQAALDAGKVHPCPAAGKDVV